jgi:hypothetical protein
LSWFNQNHFERNYFKLVNTQNAISIICFNAGKKKQILYSFNKWKKKLKKYLLINRQSLRKVYISNNFVSTVNPAQRRIILRITMFARLTASTRKTSYKHDSPTQPQIHFLRASFLSGKRVKLKLKQLKLVILWVHVK